MEGGEQSREDEQPLIEGGGGGAVEEAREQVLLAGPLIAVSMVQYSLQLISLMFVGHLGQLPLSSASIATSFAAVTGFIVLLGLGSALETLCGQSFGARHYQTLGTHTQRAMLALTLFTIPLAIIWSYTGHILTFLGQDHAISNGAADFTRPMIPGLFAFGILQCLNRFLQAQSLVLPLLLSSTFTAAFHLILCWALVFQVGMGMKGAAVANAASYWVNVVVLVVYVEVSPSCKKTWTGFSLDAVRELSGFLKLAVPSAIMICLEYWSFEMIVLLSGLLPNPKLETSVLSISLSTCWMVYMISVGLGGAISTRVSNELGAGRAKGARLALLVMVSISITLGLVVFTTTILLRNVWGKLYSNENEVIRYVARMMPLLAVSNFLDGFQCVLSGAARGCGWQNACVVINLGAYYFVALPCAILFAFVLKIGGMGLWMGIICGLSVQVISLVTLNLKKIWIDEPERASTRIQSCSISSEAPNTSLILL